MHIPFETLGQAHQQPLHARAHHRQVHVLDYLLQTQKHLTHTQLAVVVQSEEQAVQDVGAQLR
jgi:hypothetical protein